MMAVSGSLPSSIHHGSVFLTPSKLKYEAATTQNTHLPDKVLHTQKHPEIQNLLVSEHAPTSTNSNAIVKDDIMKNPPFSGRIRVNTGIDSCDCRQVHALFLKLGVIHTDAYLGNKLVVAYLRNRESLDDARKVFDKIAERRISTYAALIGSYCRSENWVSGFSVFGLMVDDGKLPDQYLLPTILKACSALQATGTGKMIHGFIVRNKFDKDIFVENALIDMYAKFGYLRCSRNVFYSMDERDVVSWTALVAAYMDRGLLDDGMDTFRLMQLEGVEADLIAWNSFLSGLAGTGDVELALQWLSEMQENGPRPNVNTWNGIISGFVRNESSVEACHIFAEMLQTPENPNIVTVVSILTACSDLKDINLGQSVHGYAIKLDYCSNIRVQGSLIDMYSKCGMNEYAEVVFIRTTNKNTAVWNEMIGAYVRDGKVKVALEILHSMKGSGVHPDEITYNTILAAHIKEGNKKAAYDLVSEMARMGLQPNTVTFNILISGFQQSGLSHESLKFLRLMQSPCTEDAFQGELVKRTFRPNPITIASALEACADLKLRQSGKEVHGYVVRNSLKSNIFVSSALVDMYAKCCDIESANTVFWQLENRNTVCWNNLMLGYISNGQPLEAFVLLKRMLEESLTPSPITFMILVPACGEAGALSAGRQLHGYILKSQFEEFNGKLTSALVDMYGKCGSILEAKRVFDCEGDKDVALWNSMISSFSGHGMAEHALALFESMKIAGIEPDELTFVALLFACARDGLLQEGWRYFNLMNDAYGITPTLEHHTCLVAIMGTAGLLEEALEFIRQMPYQPDACVWATLLRACRFHSNPVIGERAARALFELEPKNASNYILLSNIYASAGLWDAAKSIRNLMRGHHLTTIKECSTLHMGSKIYTFKGGENSQLISQDIMDMWEKLAAEMKLAGYFPLDPVFGDLEELNPLSCLHTEKLAVCFGIISSGSPKPIRMSKNVRMCIDCHMTVKLVSKITGREIFVKDSGFYHHMKDGTCSCQDRW